MSANKKAAEQNAPTGEQTIDVSALKAELMAELRAEMAAEQNAPKKMPEASKKNDYLEELVEVHLFKDGQKYKDDVFVSVNDEPPYAIKRGVPVKMKRKYALVIEASLRQDLEAVTFSSEKQSEYKKELADYNI